MDKRTPGISVVVVLLLCSLLALVPIISPVGVAWAGSAGGAEVEWAVMSGGGAPAASGSGAVTLNGSLGQTAIGPATAGTRGLGAGYWYGMGEARHEVYLPLALRSY